MANSADHGETFRFTFTVTPLTEAEAQAVIDDIRARFGRKPLIHVIGMQPSNTPLDAAPAADPDPVPPRVLQRVTELLANGQRIPAVKAIREACVGLGLKDAVEYAKTLPEWKAGERVAGGESR